MNRAVHRYEVPIGGWHGFDLTGPILHVDTRTITTVEFWALATDTPARFREFAVFGTGQELPPDGIRHVGTTLSAGGSLVWHLFERTGSAPVSTALADA